ncbi:hypothetical protein HK101_002375, partial [Irineochytrium annulatum]
AAVYFDKSTNTPEYYLIKAIILNNEARFDECLPLAEAYVSHAKSCGDYSGEFQCLWLLSLHNFARGDNTYFIEDVTNVFNSLPLLQNDALNAWMFTSSQYFIALVYGDFNFIEESKTQFEKTQHFIFTRKSGMRELLNSWHSTLLGDFTHSLQYLQQTSLLLDIDEYSRTLWLLVCLPQVVFLLMDPKTSGMPLFKEGTTAPRQWNEHQHAQLVSIVSTLRAKAYTVGVVRHHEFAWWVLHALDAALLFLGGKTANAVNLLKQKLSGKRNGIEFLLFFKGLYCGFICKYTSAASERNAHGHNE